MIHISTVTPVYCAAEYINDLVYELNRLRDHCIKINAPFRLIESIFVLDEPVDNSADLLYQLQNEYAFVKIIELSKNNGPIIAFNPCTSQGFDIDSAPNLAINHQV